MICARGEPPTPSNPGSVKRRNVMVRGAPGERGEGGIEHGEESSIKGTKLATKNGTLIFTLIGATSTKLLRESA